LTGVKYWHAKYRFGFKITFNICLWKRNEQIRVKKESEYMCKISSFWNPRTIRDGDNNEKCPVFHFCNFSLEDICPVTKVMNIKPHHSTVKTV